MDRITGTARRPASTTDAAVGHGVLDPVAALTAAPIAAAGRAEPAATAPMPGLGDTPQPDPGPPPAIGIAVAAAVGMAAVATVRSLRRSRHPARPRR
jgi:membrane-anchored mycosin MYCP